MRSARLNIFQRLARQWDALHPYNAAQALKLDGPPRPLDCIDSAWHAALHALGLGRARFVDGGDRYRFQTLNGDAAAFGVRRMADGVTLDTLVPEELNRPFGDEESFPFRPFLIEEKGFHYLGVVYHHWIADSVSIRLLLREWFLRLYDPSKARTAAVKLPAGGYWRLLGPDRARWRLDEGLLSFLRWSSRFRRARRIESGRTDDFSVGFRFAEAPAGLVGQLRETSKRHGCTINDLFMAAMALTCERFLPLARTPRRQDLALGSIVDLRPQSRDDLSDTFGLFLGFTSVICRPGDLADPDRLLRTIAAQNALHKRNGVPQASVIRLAAGFMLGHWYPRERMLRFYRKRVPMAGGISNVNLSTSWAADYRPGPLLDYLRISPTGPMMPVVFTPTTLGDQLNVSFTYRRALIDEHVAVEMIHRFLDRLVSFARVAPAERG